MLKSIIGNRSKQGCTKLAKEEYVADENQPNRASTGDKGHTRTSSRVLIEFSVEPAKKTKEVLLPSDRIQDRYARDFQFWLAKTNLDKGFEERYDSEDLTKCYPTLFKLMSAVSAIKGKTPGEACLKEWRVPDYQAHAYLIHKAFIGNLQLLRTIGNETLSVLLKENGYDPSELLQESIGGPSEGRARF